MVWSERLERRREVRVLPQGVSDEDKQLTDPSCISWISRYSPELSSSPHVCFAAGCWAGMIKLHHFLQNGPKTDNSYIISFLNDQLTISRTQTLIKQNQCLNVCSLWQQMYWSVVSCSTQESNQGSRTSLLSKFVASMSFCPSVHPGWWLPGDLYQPSGDCKDPSAGCGRDHHGAEGQRALRHQGPRLLWTLQGEKHSWGQRCMCRGIQCTEAPHVADAVETDFSNMLHLLVVSYNTGFHLRH